MKRRDLLAGVAAAFGALAIGVAPRMLLAQLRGAVLSDADQAALQTIQAYLNSIHTLKAKFLQIAPDGSTSSGIAWLQRPGRMRFQYDPPSPLLLVAGHGLVVFHDAQLEQTTNIPEGQTPLGLLLKDDIQLGGDVTVTAFSHPPHQYQVTLVRTASPGDGSLTLILSDDPITLVEWGVVDAQGRETRVRLSDVEMGGSFSASLFTFIDPKFLGPNPNANPGEVPQ